MQPQPTDRSPGLAGTDLFIGLVGAIVVAGGVVLGAVRFVGGTPELEQDLQGALGSAAFGAIFAAPGILALLSLAGRPVLLLPAATVLVPLSLVSLAGVTLPLLVPAVMLFTAYGRRSGRLPPPRLPATLTALATVVLLVLAGAALFMEQDPRSYSTPTSSGSVSDIFTYTESVIALTVVAVTLCWAWWASGRRPSV